MFTARYELGLYIKQSALRLQWVNMYIMKNSIILNPHYIILQRLIRTELDGTKHVDSYAGSS